MPSLERIRTSARVVVMLIVVLMLGAAIGYLLSVASPGAQDDALKVLLGVFTLLTGAVSARFFGRSGGDE